MLNPYNRRFDNLLDHRVLEDLAAVVLDGLAGRNEGAFYSRWEALKQQLDSRRPPEE